MSGDLALLVLGWPYLSFAGGLALLVRGFLIFRKYRILADMPRSMIGSIPMGLVQVHGKAKSDITVVSPVTKTKCLFYRVTVRMTVSGKNTHSSLKSRGKDQRGAAFYLHDETGKVLVDPYEAELDVTLTADRKVRGGQGSTWRNALFSEGDPLLSPSNRVTDYELETYAIEVLGVREERWNPLAFLSEMFPAHDPDSGQAGNFTYYLKEYCILADRWYDATGTCTWNPQPFDDTDRHMIAKGKKQPMMLISDKSEKGVELYMRLRAQQSMIGGSVLAVIGLAGILSRYGLF
jgi:hypothetical protein